jgi:rod shape-determining protein MreD
VVLQTTVVPLMQIGNARPDLLLLVIVSTSLIFGRVAGTIIGFFSGLLWDLQTAQIFGMYTLAKLITGYVMGGFEKKVFKENMILPVVAVFIATFMHECILYISAYAMEIKAPFWLMIGQTMLPNALYNCLLAPFVYFGIYHLRKSIWSGDRRSTEI